MVEANLTGCLKAYTGEYWMAGSMFSIGYDMTYRVNISAITLTLKVRHHIQSSLLALFP